MYKKPVSEKPKNCHMKLIILLLLLSVGCQSTEQIGLSNGKAPWRVAAEKMLDMEFTSPADFPSIWASLPIQSIFFRRGVPKHLEFFMTPDGKNQGTREVFWEYEVRLSSADPLSETNKTKDFMIAGPMEYFGAGSVKQTGKIHGHVDLWDFARLCLLAEEMQLYEDTKSYSSSIENIAFTQLKIVMKDGTRFEQNNWGGRASLGNWAFSSAIEKILLKHLIETR